MRELFDLIIRNGMVIDGTRRPRFLADVAIRGDRIQRIGMLDDAIADREIDALGKIVAPGFIDAHTHDDRALLSAPDMTPKVSQGVTTVIAGNCGVSIAPMPRKMTQPVTPPLDLLDDSGDWFSFPSLGAYVDRLRANPAATNAAVLVGHSTLRVATMDHLDRVADATERRWMRSLVEEAMLSGAIGVSTGLYYEPAAAATTDEIIDVCKPLAAHHGLYCTHMRNESDGVIDSLEETFRIGREVGCPVVISHHKVVGIANHGRSQETLPLIAQRMKEQRVALDCYPYCASSTILSASRVATASKVLVTWSKRHPECAGLDLDEAAKKLNLNREAAIDALRPAGAIYFSMDEGDVQRILAFDETMVGSDGLPHDAAPHPRLWGTFPRVLGQYSRDLGLFPLETAVYKMTGLTAKNFGLLDRGVIRDGAYADITIFDAATIAEGATFNQPTVQATGIEKVIVNGSVVWQDGKSTGARPGKVLQRAP